MYRIGQLVAPGAPAAAAYICEDIDNGALRLVLGDGEDHSITVDALRRLAKRCGMRIELRCGIEGLGHPHIRGASEQCLLRQELR